MCDEQKRRNFQGDFGMLLFGVKFDTVLSLMLISFFYALCMFFISGTLDIMLVVLLFVHLDRPIAMT